MSSNFHESYIGNEIKPPSERSTGLLFAAVAVIVAVWWRNSPTVPWLALAVAMGVTAVILFAPVLLKPLNIGRYTARGLAVSVRSEHARHIAILHIGV